MLAFRFLVFSYLFSVCFPRSFFSPLSQGGPDFIADFRLGIEPLDGRRSRVGHQFRSNCFVKCTRFLTALPSLLQQNSIRGDSPVAAADPSLTSAVSPAQARGKMLKRSNTSPILPSRRTSAPPEMNHLHHAQSASTVDGEHRKPHVQSMVVSKSRALDLGAGLCKVSAFVSIGTFLGTRSIYQFASD